MSKQPEVFAISGVDPEVLAYAMAKYSRSALSLQDSINSISNTTASDFLNTFYFAYGHRSIADMAHIPMAVENISMLAAIEVVDEQRWDGQERSTRYQDFSKREHYTPDDLDEVQLAHYKKTINMLFDGYQTVFDKVFEKFLRNPPEGRPADMKIADAERIMRARTFDVARYLLPMATLTSVGQITSARTLEGQVSRMKASRYPEVYDIALKLQNAAAKDFAFNPYTEVPAEQQVLAPTLLKHCAADTYAIQLRSFVEGEIEKLQPTIEHVGRDLPIADPVHVSMNCDIEREIIATLMYQYSHYPFQVLYRAIEGNWNAPRRADFLHKALELRGPHDELPRAFRANGGIIFDINLDIGAMRDLHRHRRCTQVFQDYTAESFGVPDEIGTEGELYSIYSKVMAKAQTSHEIMRLMCSMNGQDPAIADYLLPLATRRRFLMKMDVGELDYIAELRTKPQGHIAYRRIAWEMFLALKKSAPNLAKALESRVTDPAIPIDFFKR